MGIPASSPFSPAPPVFLATAKAPSWYSYSSQPRVRCLNVRAERRTECSAAERIKAIAEVQRDAYNTSHRWYPFAFCGAYG